MENLPPGSTAASGQDCPDAKPVLKNNALKPKKANRKKNGSADNTAVQPFSDQFNGVGDCGEQAPQSFPVISALQEFLQDSKTFRIPTQHSVLQWTFEQRFVNPVSNQFRATVAFLLEGVPHHVVGEWQNSKNGAKRDAAERALGLFVTQWGGQLPQGHQVSQTDSSPDSINLLQNLRNSGQTDDVQIDTFMNFCLQFPPCCRTLPRLTISWEGDACKGLAQVSLFGVPHTFAGIPCADEGAAHVDVARRVLWYLQCPGFTKKFEVDIEKLMDSSGMIASPPSDWTVDGDW